MRSTSATATAVLLDLDDTLVLDQQAAGAAFVATAAYAAGVHPSLDPALLAASARSHARTLWRACPDHAYWARIGISSWEALWCRWEGDEHPLPRMRAWRATYARAAWQRALADQRVDDHELATQLGERFAAERRARHLVFTDAGPAVRELATHHRLGLITNGAACLQREKLEASGLAASFDAVVISAELGVGKPDPAVFKEAVRRLGDPPRATMVGDSYAKDVEGALAAGLDAVWLNRDRTARPATSAPASGARPVAEIGSLRELADLIAG